MTDTPVSPGEQIRFLENFQTLLAEGQFTATYKYALLVALADLAVELGDDSGATLEIPIRRIAEKFVGYYWNHTLPWAPVGGRAVTRILSQNTGKSAAVLSCVLEVRERISPYRMDVRGNKKEWHALVSEVARIVKLMPLWKLQRLRGRVLDFLYENAGRGDTVTLRPGVAFNLRRFHSLVTGMARGAWADFVRRVRANQTLLGQATDLHVFLFGTERNDLSGFRLLLRELQKDACFYCAGHLGSGPAVDHSVPWGRYPIDLGHNFVLADSACNAVKRDFLPDVPFLERWVRRNVDHREALLEGFELIHVQHDIGVSFQITTWAYEQLERSGGMVWAGGKRYASLGRGWRELLESGSRRSGG